MSVNLLHAKAAVAMLTRLVAAKRASPSKLQDAIEHLRALTSASLSRRTVEFQRESVRVETVERKVEPSDEIAKAQADLSAEADVLFREQADISQQIIDFDPQVPCPHLTGAVIAKRQAIERIWTKKKHIERNGLVDDEEDEPEERTKGDIDRLDVIVGLLKKLRDQRYKLSKKLENEGAKEASKVKWSTEFAIVNAEIEELKNERDLI
jgi:hypothetical protein